MGKRPIRGLLRQAVVWSTGHLISKKRNPGPRIPILCYHRVLPELIGDDLFDIDTILPEQFESQMACLAGEGFTSLSLEEYARVAKGINPIGERFILITFDDGYADNYVIAWQIARKYNVKINLFICTGNIGQPHPIVMMKDGYEILNSASGVTDEAPVSAHIRKYPQLWRPLTWQELREMQDARVQIGLHGHRHRNLALLRPEEIVKDITTGISVIERELGYRCRFFALPYGWFDSYTTEVISTLTGSGLDLIFAAHLGRARLPTKQPVFPRILINQQDDLVTFKRKLFGAYDWWEGIRKINYLAKALLQKQPPFKF